MSLNKSKIKFLYLGDTSFFDMLDIFGAEKTKLFIKIWGGTTLKVPTLQDIENCDIDYSIYSFISEQIENNFVSLEEAALECSRKYKRRPEYCINTYRNLQKFSEQIDVHEEQLEKIFKNF